MPESTDILMRMKASSGELRANSLTRFTTTMDEDQLRKGFNPGYFCDLIDFSFSAGIEGALSAHAKKRTKAAAKLEQETLLQAGKDAKGERTTLTPKQISQVREDIVKQQERHDSKRLDTETVDMQPVDFTRIMDLASVQLLNLLKTSEPLQELSIVKRKAGGVSSSGLCYLRLDFKNVLLTRLEWKDQQQVMHESGTFIYRELTMQYRPQAPSGALGDAIFGSWTMKTMKPQN